VERYLATQPGGADEDGAADSAGDEPGAAGHGDDADDAADTSCAAARLSVGWAARCRDGGEAPPQPPTCYPTPVCCAITRRPAPLHRAVRVHCQHAADFKMGRAAPPSVALARRAWWTRRPAHRHTSSRITWVMRTQARRNAALRRRRRRRGKRSGFGSRLSAEMAAFLGVDAMSRTEARRPPPWQRLRRCPPRVVCLPMTSSLSSDPGGGIPSLVLAIDAPAAVGPGPAAGAAGAGGGGPGARAQRDPAAPAADAAAGRAARW